MIYRKLIDTLVFSDGRQHETVLDDLAYLRAIQIEFPNGVLTAAGGAADGALIEDGLLKAILKVIELKADGTDSFVNTVGLAEYWRRAIMSGSSGVHVSTMPTGAAATAQRVSVIIDMDQIMSAARFLGRIDTVHLDSLKLRILNGVVETDMVTGGDRAESMTGDLEVIGIYDTNPAAYKGSGRRIGWQRHTITAASADARLILPSGLIYAQFLFVAVDNGVRDADILQRVEVRIGENDYQRDMSFEALQSANVEWYGLELSSGAPPYTGVAILDFDEDRDMSPAKVLNTEGLKTQTAKVVMTVGSPTGVSYVDMYYYAVDRRGVGSNASRSRRRAALAARVATGRRRG